ncbi:hypothetical protein VTK26DRAFT_7700 [Humicola hyalothermophila]
MTLWGAAMSGEVPEDGIWAQPKQNPESTCKCMYLAFTIGYPTSFWVSGHGAVSTFPRSTWLGIYRGYRLLSAWPHINTRREQECACDLLFFLPPLPGL